MPVKNDHERPSTDEAWHLDKKIPISLILYLIVQTATIVWYGARLDQNLDGVMDRTSKLEIWRDAQNGTEAKTEAHLSVLDERSKNESETLRRIEDKLEETLKIQHQQPTARHNFE